MIETLIEQIRATGTHLFSLTAMEDGNAQTFLFYPANPCNDTYSVAKVFTMTAIGLCFDCKIIKPSDKITDIFCAQLPAGIDPRWAEVTIDDVLRHRMGIAKGFLDIDVEDMTTYPSHDFLSLILRTKLDYAPGEQYCYSDAAYYLLSRVVTAVSGEGLDNLLMREILLPIGCREAGWSKCPMGYAMGATGLYIRSTDIAHLGQLYLNRGVWEGRRLLSADWIELAEARGYSLTRRDNGAYTKGGMRGQMFYYNPTTGRAVGWLSYDTEGRSQQILKLLVENHY